MFWAVIVLSGLCSIGVFLAIVFAENTSIEEQKKPEREDMFV
jgi:hypothetical protein